MVTVLQAVTIVELYETSTLSPKSPNALQPVNLVNKPSGKYRWYYRTDDPIPRGSRSTQHWGMLIAISFT
jgi:hypothetical protein